MIISAGEAAKAAPPGRHVRKAAGCSNMSTATGAPSSEKGILFHVGVFIQTSNQTDAAVVFDTQLI